MTIKEKRRSRFILGLLGALALASLLVGTALVINTLRPDWFWEQQDFDSSTWKATPPTGRRQFVRALVDSDMLLGRDRESVVDLLGPPSDGSVANLLDYTIAEPAWFSLTFDSVYFLRMHLDKSGRVVKVELGGD
jgi:hypothetical protein